MAGEGVERRKSTRIRGEPPVKLRQTSPAQDVSAASTPSTRRAKETKTPMKDTPTRGKPGPKPKKGEAVKASTPPRHADLEDQDAEEPIFMSIQEAMEKSRNRWLNEGGIFERFWTKPPRKKKGQPAVDMPSKAQMNMIEIAQARIIIEPHVFDVTMYGVKKAALSWQPPVAVPATNSYHSSAPNAQRPIQNPYPRPGTTQPGSNQPAPGTPTNPKNVSRNPYAISASNSQTQNSQSLNTPTQLAPQNRSMQTATSPASTSTAKTDSGSKFPQAESPQDRISEANVDRTSQPHSDPGRAPSVQVEPPRSATNTPIPPSRVQTPQLTASAQATPEPSGQPPVQPPVQPAPIKAPAPRAQTARPPPAQQQRQQPQQSVPHPDPVIQMLAQRAASDPALKDLMKLVAAGNTSPEKLKEFQRHIDEINEIVAKQKSAKPAPQQQSKTSNASGRAQQKPAQQQYRAQTFIASKPQPPPQPRYDFGSVVFDFVRGSDCYALPRMSIVEHLSDGMTTLISFIVTRKGKDVPESKRLKPDVEYYQPMTMELLTMEQKVRDAINQAVMPKDVVNKAMKEIMKRCTLAPTRGVMLKVPEGQDVALLKRSGDNIEADTERDSTTRMEWDAPDSLLPL